MVSSTQTARICVSFYYLTSHFKLVPLRSLLPSVRLVASCVLATGFLALVKLSLADWQIVGLGILVFGVHLLLIRDEVLGGWSEVFRAKAD